MPCGQTTCTGGQVCCIWPMDPKYQSYCAAPGQCGGHLSASCNEGADCAPGQVCCMEIDNGVGKSISCVTSCTGNLVCTDNPTVCQGMDVCSPVDALPEGFLICLPPVSEQ